MATKKKASKRTAKKAAKKSSKKTSSIKSRVIDLSKESLAARAAGGTLSCPGTCQRLTVVTAARQPRGLIIVL